MFPDGRAGRMHRPGSGAAHRGTAILAIADGNTITVIVPTTGEIRHPHHQPHTQLLAQHPKEPGRWPGSQSER